MGELENGKSFTKSSQNGYIDWGCPNLRLKHDQRCILRRIKNLNFNYNYVLNMVT